jgi:hypothetical protein
MNTPRVLFATAALLLGLGTACEKTFDYDPAAVPSNYPGIPAPAAGEGFQIHVPPFPVPPNFEREWFMRMAIGNTEEVYVNRFMSSCRPGTHHVIAYGFEDENAPGLPEIGVMRDQNRADGRGNFRGNMLGNIAYFISQQREYDLVLPEGYAIRIPANATVDMNSHYFNKTDETQFGEVYLNAYTRPVSEVQKILDFEDVDNADSLTLPPNSIRDITFTQIFPESYDLTMMFAHMHKRGKRFDVYFVGGPRDGELLYTSTDYAHAPTMFFTPAMRIEAGQGLRTVVRYVNETNRTISFGVTSEDEMGILFYLYSLI